MNQAPKFFMPAATDAEMAESAYKAFAENCGRAVPPPAERIYSITFGSDGESWTATVGEQLSGRTDDVVDRQGRLKRRGSRIGDPGTVLAIFEGVPYMVCTNEGIGGMSVRSKFANPFLVGEPYSVTYFSCDEAGT